MLEDRNLLKEEDDSGSLNSYVIVVFVDSPLLWLETCWLGALCCQGWPPMGLAGASLSTILLRKLKKTFSGNCLDHSELFRM